MGSIHHCIDCICSRVKYLEEMLELLSAKVAKITPSPTPPTPPTPAEAGSLAGVSVKITDKSDETIELNGYFEFNEIIENNTNGAVEISSEDGATVFTLTKTGTYFFSWQIYLIGYVMSVSVEVNGVIIPGHWNHAQNDPLVGTEIVVVDNVPTTVKLINNGRSSVRFADDIVHGSLNILCQITD